MAAPRHGDPDAAGKLRGEFMKLERSEQAKHRLRCFDGDESKPLELRCVGLGQAIQPTANTLQLSLGRESAEHDPRCAERVQVAGA